MRYWWREFFPAAVGKTAAPRCGEGAWQNAQFLREVSIQIGWGVRIPIRAGSEALFKFSIIISYRPAVTPHQTKKDQPLRVWTSAKSFQCIELSLYVITVKKMYSTQN